VEEAQAEDVATIVTGYYCPPCGCDKDEETFHEHGRCPSCNMKLIAVGTHMNRTPAVSPDGQTIAFISTRDGNMEVYAMRSDGTRQQRLTHNEAGDDEHMSWSPDGARIAYTSFSVQSLAEASKTGEIYVMNADGTERVRLTDNTAWDGLPQWSPDGARIAFQSARDGNAEVYLMQADGSNQVNLTNHEGRDVRPQWVPDGTGLLFNSNRSGQFARYRMNSDGSAVTPVTEDEAGAWSPDGRKLAFVRFHERNGEIFVRNADGSGEVQLTDTPGFSNTNPVWSPDGSQIFFDSDRDGQPEIYAMQEDGTAQTPLTRQ
jgi:TolB protein